MNIQDVKDLETTLSFEEGIKLIFDTQRELMEKYHHIEKRNGFHVNASHPLNLHHKYDQHKAKDLAWRTVEEIAEAMDAESEEHFYEELIDGLHFLTELMISSDISEEEAINHIRLDRFFEGKDCLLRFIMHLGCAMNYLKNKPWKNTHMETDIQAYRSRLLDAWEYYWIYMYSAGLAPDRVFNYYYKKSEVNKFRQRSNY